jgi:hypothetical protein
MPIYRFYEFAEDGRCTRFDDHECTDDAGAIAFAHRLPNRFGLEVWRHNDPRVKIIEPAQTGFTVEDASPKVCGEK